MRFTADAHPQLADGSVTLTFRTWARPQVRVGGRYRVGELALEVDSIERVEVAAIPDEEVRRAGAATRDELLRRLGPADVVWRVAFHRVEAGPDPRAVLAADDDLSADDVAALSARLDRLDAASPHGPWTRTVLALIAEHPGVVSTELARVLGRERLAFKADVRKLKALGLTESLEVGYRLSPRGQALQRALAGAGPG